MVHDTLYFVHSTLYAVHEKAPLLNTYGVPVVGGYQTPGLHFIYAGLL